MPDDRPEAESTLHLLELARSGDHHAVDRLFARHARPLQRWASGRFPKWARDLSDTGDLVQDALLRTFKRVGQLEARGAGAFQAYLRRAILNRIREELRRHGRRPEGTGLTGLEAAENYSSPLEQAIGAEAIERYDTALARLKPEEQETLIGRIELGYTYEELAQALGKPTADAVRKAAQRALIRLVQEMGRDGG